MEEVQRQYGVSLQHLHLRFDPNWVTEVFCKVIHLKHLTPIIIYIKLHH